MQLDRHSRGRAAMHRVEDVRAEMSHGLVALRRADDGTAASPRLSAIIVST